MELLRDKPEFFYDSPVTEKGMRWLGRAEAILQASNSINDQISFRVAVTHVNTMIYNEAKLLQPLYNVLSALELKVPSSMQGAFIPPGDTWNGYSALIRLIQRDCTELLVVDPYLNSDIYLYFAPHIQATKGLFCLASKQSQAHAGLVAAKEKWNTDSVSQGRFVEVRYAPERTLHDRLIIIDGKEVWLISQSIKDIAKRSPASVTRADNDTAHLKSQHYVNLWSQSSLIS